MAADQPSNNELIEDAKKYVDEDFTIEVRPDPCSGGRFIHYRAPWGRISLAMGECRPELRLITVERLRALEQQASLNTTVAAPDRPAANDS